MNSIFESWHHELTNQLSYLLDNLTPEHKFREVIKYSSLPAGKLFRPLIVMSLAKDLGTISEDHRLFACCLEMHHTYTLIHDDLPAMDNDDFRRGRLSSHKKFTEFEAILAGDALLNMSYEVIAGMKHPKSIKLLQYMTTYTGPKGLIFGQVKDLAQENKTFQDLLKIHELKTSRLIQLALTGTSILSNKEEHLDKLYTLGNSIGINFQLLDDLCELSEIQKGHELEINPFLTFAPAIVFEEIQKNHKIIETTCLELELNNFFDYFKIYLNKVNEIINKNKQTILSQIKTDDFQLF